MINEIIDTILSEDITDLAWVDKYGGLATPVSWYDEIDGVEFRNTFPVSCNVTPQDCFSNGKYLELTPNSNYKSLLYWEDLTGLIVTGGLSLPKGQRMTTLTANVRLVVWCNLARLGITDCYIPASVIFNLIRLIEKRNLAFTVGSDTYDVSIEFRRATGRNQEVFERYTYSDEILNNLLYPFDYTALEFQINVNVNMDCIGDFTPEAEIECETP